MGLDINKDVLWEHASSASIGRGQAYYEEGAVEEVTRRGDEVVAWVMGSMPYQVRLKLGKDGVDEVKCTCPYAYGGWCKHIVAVVLACLAEPDLIEDRPAVADLVADLSVDQLRALVTDLAQGDPALGDHVERWTLMHRSGSTKERAGKKPASIDAKAVTRRVRSILRSLEHLRPSEAYWHVGGVAEQVSDEIRQARLLVEAGEAPEALRYLEGIAEACVDAWGYLDDSNGEVGDLFPDLDDAFAEAILSTELSPQDRERLAERMNVWRESAEEYGVDGPYGVALGALGQPWDDSALLRVLDEGVISAQGVWDGEAPWYSDDLAVVRLRVLERQGRFEEYLRLAEAEGQEAAYVTMLARLGRVDEAASYGIEHLVYASEFLSLARVLDEKGVPEEALRVAEAGLARAAGPYELYNAGPTRAELADWASARAEGAGRGDLALEAARTAFEAVPSLARYRRVEVIAGTAWPEQREPMLDRLRRVESSPEVAVTIFLDEDLVDDAIAVADRSGYDTIVRRVAEAAEEARPDWVAKAAIRQAEMIIEPGRSEYYVTAVEWLGLARQAYLQMQDEAGWREYMAKLTEVHGRKHKLMGLVREKLPT